MIECMLILMMIHGLLFILLSMPKYNRQLPDFPKKAKNKEKSYKLFGYMLLMVILILAIVENGYGVGFTWFFALITLVGSGLSVSFGVNTKATTHLITLLPQLVFGKLYKNLGLFYFVFYFAICFLYVF